MHIINIDSLPDTAQLTIAELETMGKDMTPKQEQFARLYVETGKGISAKRRAYRLATKHSPICSRK